MGDSATGLLKTYKMVSYMRLFLLQMPMVYDIVYLVTNEDAILLLTAEDHPMAAALAVIFHRGE